MSAERVWTIPNILTFGRLGLSVVLFVLIAFEAWGWCLIVFLLAGLTDWLDGWLARILNAGTALGRVLDPLVDKVMMGGIFIFLLPEGTRAGWLMPWMVAVIICREMLITGLRGHLESLGIAFGADWLGKVKMVVQCAAVVAIFLALLWPDAGFAPWRTGLIWAMVLITIASGLQYLAKIIFPRTKA